MLEELEKELDGEAEHVFFGQNEDMQRNYQLVKSLRRYHRNPEGWDTGGGRREAKRSLKAVIVVGQPFPRPRAHLHGNVGLRLPPCLLGPTDRKQSAPGAAGKRLVSGVSASAEDSEAAVVPEPEECL
ncbi:hypothetical protein AB1E19_017057 [Capra hircus]